MGYREFCTDGNSRWYWRWQGNDGSSVVSGNRFLSRDECVVDALRYGYLDPRSGVSQAMVAGVHCKNSHMMLSPLVTARA